MTPRMLGGSETPENPAFGPRITLSAMTGGLDLRRPDDRQRCRERIERAHDSLRFAEIHAEAERLTGRSFGLLRHARAAIADAWLIEALDFQAWVRRGR